MTDVFWPGLVAMGVFYVAVFATGALAARLKPTGNTEAGTLEELLLAGRSLPLWVGLLTMTATWVGGGYINGTAESTYSAGLLWGGQAGLGYAASLVLGGLFYARTMRRYEYATLVDPLEARYGNRVAALLMVPAVLAELFWSAAILVALGSTFATIMGLDQTVSIAISASIAIAYTVLGGLRAVAYTDVIQLVLILIGLGIALPYVVDAAGGWSALGGHAGTIGFASTREGVSYGDWFILLMLGGIPWNVYFQRVLSAPSEKAASGLSLGAGVVCLLMAIPPLLLGVAARGIDWNAVAGPEMAEQLAAQPAIVLPFLLRYAVPTTVGVIGLGAIAAAVMSSVDSSILSASSLAAWNGYKRLLNPDASVERVATLVRVLIVVLGVFATGIALTVGGVQALWYLCGDVVYTVLFPQLTLALFDRKANRYGALTGLGVSVFLRLGGGDATLGLPAFLPYPDWSDAGVEFPFRTLAMAAGLLTAVIVARLTQGMDPARPLGRLTTDDKAAG